MNILVAVDFSESTEKIVRKTEDMAKKFLAKIWVLHVAEPDPDFVGYDVGPETEKEFMVEKFHKEHREVQDIAKQLRKKELDATALLVQGATAETILKEAAKLDADMIVVGSHGRGAMYQLLVGSVSEEVLRKAKCSILVIPTHNRA